MKRPSIKDNCNTPAVEIPIQKVSPGRLASNVDNLEFQFLFCRQAVVRQLEALEDSLNEESIHTMSVLTLFGSFIDASKALLTANHGLVDRQMLELFCDRFAETVVLIGEKMQAKGVGKEYCSIMLSQFGVITQSQGRIKMEIMNHIPLGNNAEEDWEEYESRPTNPYNEDLACRLQRYMEAEQKMQSVGKPDNSNVAPDSRLLAPQDSLSPTDCSQSSARQKKSGRDKIVVISAMVGLGALTAVGITTFGKKHQHQHQHHDQVSAGASVAPEPHPARLNTSDTLDAAIIPETEPTTENPEKKICLVDTSATGFANYMTVIRKGNPLLAELMDQSFATAVMETKDGNEEDKVVLMEAALNRMGEMSQDAGNNGYKDNIVRFVEVHSAALNKYKQSGVWQSGQEQTRLLYDKLQLDCQKTENKL